MFFFPWQGRMVREDAAISRRTTLLAVISTVRLNCRHLSFSPCSSSTPLPSPLLPFHLWTAECVCVCVCAWACVCVGVQMWVCVLVWYWSLLGEHDNGFNGRAGGGKDTCQYVKQYYNYITKTILVPFIYNTHGCLSFLFPINCLCMKACYCLSEAN